MKINIDHKTELDQVKVGDIILLHEDQIRLVCFDLFSGSYRMLDLKDCVLSKKAYHDIAEMMKFYDELYGIVKIIKSNDIEINER